MLTAWMREVMGRGEGRWRGRGAVVVELCDRRLYVCLRKTVCQGSWPSVGGMCRDVVVGLGFVVVAGSSQASETDTST